MRGTCFVARRLDVVAIAGMLLTSWGVFRAAGFRVFFPFVFLLTHTACCKYEAPSLHFHVYLYSDRQTEPGPGVGQFHNNLCIAPLHHIFYVRDWPKHDSLTV